MRFEYDENKNRENKRKHGVSLNEAKELWKDHHIVVPAKNVSGERRYFIIGKTKNKIYVAIFTKRKNKIRIISCHRADKKLERIYYEKIE